MTFDKFTTKAQESIMQAQQLTTSQGQQAIEAAHLLKGMMQADENVIPFLLKKLNVNIPQLEKGIETLMATYPKVSGGQVYMSNDGSQILTKALSMLKEFGDEYVTTAHILLAMLQYKNKTGLLLKEQGLNEKDLHIAIIELRKGENVTSSSAEETYNALNKYARNLNELAQAAKLDPVIGRDEEIRRVLQILSRRTKNNPILIGE
ncbi:MAG TPA: Clp protease N-terminal domain-containing protein, partial [Bacteroidia bacterium]|nr:Clp protease N-terminal domain-containing protein [Bacteroidia bacterium]